MITRVASAAITRRRCPAWAASIAVGASLVLGGAHAGAAGCDAALPADARRVESARHVLVFAPTPAPITVGRQFAIEAALCLRSNGGAPPGDSSARPHGTPASPGVTPAPPAGTSTSRGMTASALLPKPRVVRLDAVMPEHRHGMNYRASVTARGDGRFVADGLLFHMPGRWQLVFDVESSAGAERLVADVVVE